MPAGVEASMPAGIFGASALIEFTHASTVRCRAVEIAPDGVGCDRHKSDARGIAVHDVARRLRLFNFRAEPRRKDHRMSAATLASR